MSIYTFMGIGLGVISAAMVVGFPLQMYKEGKSNMEAALRKFGIDDLKDVRLDVYMGNINNSESSHLYTAAYNSDPQVKETIEIAKLRYLKCEPEKRNPEKFTEILLKTMMPEERLSIIKKRKRDKYRASAAFLETFHIESLSLV